MSYDHIPRDFAPHADKQAQALNDNDLLLWSALPDLFLNIAQTAALCGISVRQLGYWTKQGYVKASGKGVRRLYGMDSLRRILAIRQSMQEGLSLRQALRSLDRRFSFVSVPQSSAPAFPALSSKAYEIRDVQDSEDVERDLRCLFKENKLLRDSAAGLAAKIGRAEDGVRSAAEAMIASGELIEVMIGSLPIYTLCQERSAG
jgi:DNA-binding transcriptional MerR regulator